MTFEELMERLNGKNIALRDATLGSEIYTKIAMIAHREGLSEGDIICIMMKLLAAVVVQSRPPGKRDREREIELVCRGMQGYLTGMFQLENNTNGK